MFSQLFNQFCCIFGSMGMISTRSKFFGIRRSTPYRAKGLPVISTRCPRSEFWAFRWNKLTWSNKSLRALLIPGSITNSSKPSRRKRKLVLRFVSQSWFAAKRYPTADWRVLSKWYSRVLISRRGINIGVHKGYDSRRILSANIRQNKLFPLPGPPWINKTRSFLLGSFKRSIAQASISLASAFVLIVPSSWTGFTSKFT